MTSKQVHILPFHPQHQSGIDRMMTEIAGEFSEPIFSPKSKKIADIAAFSNNRFWVAVCQDKAVGTIGLTTLSNHSIVLKSMFLVSSFRGLGVGKLLLKTLEEWCQKNDYGKIYLGTMTQFSGGQKFYEKNEFRLISKAELPSDFPINPLDAIHYKKTLEASI